MSTEVIKSFLVSLGFKVDESSSKKFSNSVSDAEKTVKVLAGLAASATIAVGAMVSKYTNEMENLFYVGQRTKSSVEGIEALQSGAERVGIAAQDATHMLETMMMKVKTDPGYSGIVSKMIGSDARTTPGDEVIERIFVAISKAKPEMQALLADMLKLDPQHVMQITQNMDAFLAGLAERKAKITTNDTKFAEAAKDYANSWRDVYDQITNAGHAITIGVLPIVQSIAKTTADILKYFTDLTKLSFVGGAVKMLSDMFVLAKNIKGMFTDGKVYDHKTIEQIAEKDPWTTWKPSKDGKNEPAASPSIASSIASSLANSSNFNYGNVRMISSPGIGLGTGHQPWMDKPKNITINQKTEINLHGDTTDQAIRDINRSVADTNSATLRNTTGATR